VAERRKLIVGNWKMNGLREAGDALAENLATKALANPPSSDVVVCPPATLLAKVNRAFEASAIALGAQDCHAAEKGAHTGDVSAEMLRDAGCEYVMVGHSERRTDHAEDNAAVQAKASAVNRAGMTAIVCVGETGAERDAGDTLNILGRQAARSLPPGADGANTVVAYEPVWAIGSGRTPTLAEIAAVHHHIRVTLATEYGSAAEGIRVLYGGSVNASNAIEILAVDAVDGALVGGASLKADHFWQIVEAARS
jgi:triosephosphate isomerase